MSGKNTQFQKEIKVEDYPSGNQNEDVVAILDLCEQFRTKKIERIEWIKQLNEYLDNKFKINPIFDKGNDDKSIGLKALNIQRELADRRIIIQQCNQLLKSVNDDFVRTIIPILMGERRKQFQQCCKEAKKTFEEWVKSAEGIDRVTAISLINHFAEQFPLTQKEELVSAK